MAEIFRYVQEVWIVVKPELGTKRGCPNCAARFYDLLKDPIECPKCGYTFVAETLLPSKMEQQSPVAPAKAAATSDAADDDDDDLAEVDIVSLDDVDEGAEDTDDDEVVGIEDVEVDDATLKSKGDDDTFLEEDEDDDTDVTGIIGGSLPDSNEER